ncbi:MAG TPA: hypothetical protein VEY11_16445 [Pyrinomonadaceae bacterium]|nr:hypothetical protein [Pyrinomonadaceae bacterium]
MARLYSTKRLILSIILGFLLPLGYAFALSTVSDITGEVPPDFMVMPFGWPRPLWIFLAGRQPSEADVVHGLLFMAACNILLYGTAVYAASLLLELFRRKSDGDELPPPPVDFRPRDE